MSAEERQDEILSDFCREFSRHIPALLAARSVVASGEVSGAVEGATIARKIGPVAANYQMKCGEAQLPLLVSFDLSNAASLTDRLFGGDGLPSDEEPGELPTASALALEKIAEGAGRSLALSALDSSAVSLTGQNDTISRLNGFERGTRYVRWNITVTQSGYREWHFLMALREADLVRMCARQKPAGDASERHGEFDPKETPFGEIPFTLRAELTHFHIPISKLGRLRPGDVLPVSIGRDVPLLLNDREIERGIIGQIDNRIALQLGQQSRKGIAP